MSEGRSRWLQHTNRIKNELEIEQKCSVNKFEINLENIFIFLLDFPAIMIP